MFLNMDGFDDNAPSDFYGANSWDTAFSTSPTSAFSPRASGSVAENPTSSNLHSTDQTTSSASELSRSSISTGPLARSREDDWQMYLTPAISDSLNSLDHLDILNPDSVDHVYPPHTLTDFAEFETLESPRSSGYQGTRTVNDDDQQMFCTTTPLVTPQPRVIQPALLSLVSTQDTENSLLSAQGEGSTNANEHSTVYPSSLLGVGILSAPQFDTYLSQSAPSSSLLSTSRVRDPTITKLVNHPSTSTRPRRGLSGWGTTNYLEPSTVPSSTTTSTMHRKPPSTSSSKSINSGLMVPDSCSPSLCSSTTGGSSSNSGRLPKRLRPSDEYLPVLKRAPKTRRITVADIDTEDDSVDNDNGDDDSDSDDYRPSRSPSLDPSQRSISPSPHSFVFKSETGVDNSVNNNTRKRPRKGKGKAKGSAALALAVVSQMVRNPSTAGRRADIDLTSTRYTTGITRRKNQPIPLPIPVPNLNKKSRGRKVPHVANNDNTVMKRKSSSSTKVYVKQEDVEDDDEDNDDESGDEFEENRSRSSTSHSRRKRPSKTPEMSKTSSGENRTFVCVVPGCGKCFVRSEHLKRHVRSIHTHDKREFWLF